MFILIQRCYSSPKLAWTVAQTTENQGIDRVSLLIKCNIDNWGSCEGQCAKSENWNKNSSDIPASLLSQRKRHSSVCIIIPRWCFSQRCIRLAPRSSSPFGSQPRFLFPHTCLGKISSSSLPLSAEVRGDQSKKKRMKKTNQRGGENTHVATTENLLKHLCETQTLWGTSVIAVRTGGGRKRGQ